MKLKQNCCWFSIVKMATTQCRVNRMTIDYSLLLLEQSKAFDILMKIMNDDRQFIFKNMSNHIHNAWMVFEIQSIDIVHIACSCPRSPAFIHFIHSIHHIIDLMSSNTCHVWTAFPAYILSHCRVCTGNFCVIKEQSANVSKLNISMHSSCLSPLLLFPCQNFVQRYSLRFIHIIAIEAPIQTSYPHTSNVTLKFKLNNIEVSNRLCVFFWLLRR